jgi:hypothetical protein
VGTYIGARLEDDELHLTHEFLSIMLGVRRAGVTTALHQLERSGLISMKRSSVTMIDRDGLKKTANGLYGVPEAEFERLFPSPEITHAPGPCSLPPIAGLGSRASGTCD